MRQKHIFVLFKLPRTGSSRLAVLLSEHPECFCEKEILNSLGKAGARREGQAHIEAMIGNRRERNIGFTLNPGKQKADLEFFDYRRRFADRKLVVFTLTRRNVLNQTMSVFVAKKAGAFPGHRNTAKAEPLLRLVDERVHVPPDVWNTLLQKTLKKNKDCIAFASAFAARFEAPLVPLTYEGIYEGDHADMAKLFGALEVTDGIPVPDQGEKLLPPPETFVTNYPEIQALTAERLDHRS